MDAVEYIYCENSIKRSGMWHGFMKLSMNV